MIKDENPKSKVFTYRNLVKALPWYSEVRELLEKPEYSGFFLKFKKSDGSGNDTHVPRCDA